MHRGQPAQATHAVWWLYTGAGPTGQADVGNKATRHHCPASLARIRAPLPHFASISLRQSKAATHRAITAELHRAHAPLPQHHSLIARAHRSPISPSTSSTTHHLSLSQDKHLRASLPSPDPRQSAAELALAVAMLHRAISLTCSTC